MQCAHLIDVEVPYVEGAKLFYQRPYKDDRGTFMRMFCERELNELGFRAKQVNLSETTRVGAIRGLHYQEGLAKLVYCLAGEVFDVVLDVRDGSSTFGQHARYRLVPGQYALYVPPGCAHGFQTIQAPAVMLYFYSDFYEDHKELGIRYNDPKFTIQWPNMVTLVSDKDSSWPLWGDTQ